MNRAGLPIKTMGGRAKRGLARTASVRYVPVAPKPLAKGDRLSFASEQQRR